MTSAHVYQEAQRIFLQLGPITWYRYSFMIMLGLAIAIILGVREGNKLGITTNDIIDGVILIVPLSIIGTRLWYVIFEWEQYAGDIMKIFAISDGGLAIHGGFITAFISAYFYTRYKKINLFSAFDIMVPGFLIAQASGRWGNFFNQEAHGGVIGGVSEDAIRISNSNWDTVSDAAKVINEPFWDQQRAFLSDTLRLPDFITNNMFINGPDGYNYYHPTFLYESVWNVVGFIIVLILRRTKLLKVGDLLAFYLVWYSVGRFFIEAMRTDSLYVGDTGIRTAQLISILMIIGGIIYFVVRRFVMKPKNYVDQVEETKEVADTIEKVIFDSMVLEENLSLPSGTDVGLVYLWKSQKEHVLSSDGIISRKDKDQTAVLTLTAIQDEIKVSKNYKFTIKAK